jgi:hypothetical protein
MNAIKFPQILALNKNGEPLKWISHMDSCVHYAKGNILWSLGEYKVNLRGGTNAKTGLQTVMVMDTIVAINNGVSPSKYRKMNPVLTNKTLFERDRNLCAYCGAVFKKADLTRDHIVPSSKGGKDTWENCVTACYHCNQWKADRTPEEAEMKLLYVPYAPSFSEFLILQNRNILACQMDYLLAGVSKHSRIRAELLN